MEEKEIANGAGEIDAPKVDQPVIDNHATPAKEDDVDDTEDMSEYGVPPMPADEEEPEEKPVTTPPEQKKDDVQEEAELPPIAPLEPRTSGLDRRLAKVYIQNCLMAGEENIPTEDQILADLKKYGKDEKIASLHSHLAERKRLRGEKPTANNLEEEDIEAIRDAERESIRHELLAEEHEKKVMGDFVEFLGKHTELIPDNDENKKSFQDAKPYDPVVAQAVETLFKNGMTIDKAYETVMSSISAVKTDEKNEVEINKQRLLSGAVSASNDLSKGSKKMTWAEFDALRTSDPDRYEKLLDDGYEPVDE